MSKTTSCKHCGKSGLIWRNTDKGWRLAEGIGGKIHNCISTESYCNTPKMGVISSKVVQPKYLVPEDYLIEQSKEHESKMNQDENYRITMMIRGYSYE